MKKEMLIRKANLEDAEEISKLIQTTVQKINLKDLTKEQVEAWIKHYSTREVKKIIPLMDFFVLIKENSIKGVVFLEKDFLKGIYISPEELGKGYGKNLLNFIEHLAKKKGISKISLNSSKYALNFYKKNKYIFKKKAYSTLYGANFCEDNLEKELS